MRPRSALAVVVAASLACGITNGPEAPADVAHPVHVDRPGYAFDAPGNWVQEWYPWPILLDTDVIVASPGGCTLQVSVGTFTSDWWETEGDLAAVEELTAWGPL